MPTTTSTTTSTTTTTTPSSGPDPAPVWPSWTPALVRGRPPTLGSSATFWLRQISGLTPTDRLARHVEREQMLHELAQLDETMREAAEHRIELLHHLALLRDTLYPRTPWPRGRRPPDHRHPLIPPATERAEPIAGPILRQACLQILARHGPLRLPDIHAWLHRYGYLIAHPHPVKALADALGHEHDHHRATRIARGTYALARTHPTPATSPLDPTPDGDPTTIVDPLTDPPTRRADPRTDNPPTDAASEPRSGAPRDPGPEAPGPPGRQHGGARAAGVPHGTLPLLDRLPTGR